MKDVHESSFDRILLESHEHVLVDFYASWCGPCKVVGPMLERLEEKWGDQVTFIKVNSDNNRKLAEAFGVKSLPTVLLLKTRAPDPGADLVNYTIGAKPPAHFEKMLDKAVNPKPGLLKRLMGRG